MDAPSDPQTTAMATKVASAAVEEAKGLIGAKKILAKEGLEPKAVNLKTFVPLLEAGALEEDDEMAERWASLLASAANPTAKDAVEPSFIEILRQLTPLQARILDVTYALAEREKIPAAALRRGASAALSAAAASTVPPARIHSHASRLAKLLRLVLCTQSRSGAGARLCRRPAAATLECREALKCSYG